MANLRYYGRIPKDAPMITDARGRAEYQLTKYEVAPEYIPKVIKPFDSMLEGRAKLEQTTCKKCNSPLNAGECDLCRDIDSITANIPDAVIPNTDESKKIWNWEQFFKLVADDESFIITPVDDDAKIEERIAALQEVERQTELFKQAVRIRIQVDETELESRGKVAKKSRAKNDMTYQPRPLPVVTATKAKMSKVDKAKVALAELGIDFDKLMADD